MKWCIYVGYLVIKLSELHSSYKYVGSSQKKWLNYGEKKITPNFNNLVIPLCFQKQLALHGFPSDLDGHAQSSLSVIIGNHMCSTIAQDELPIKRN